MSAEENLTKLANMLTGIEHSNTANSKYKYGSVMRFIADLTGLPPDSVYVSQISKPDNLDVRFGQSKDARKAKLGIGLILAEKHQKYGDSFSEAAYHFSEEYGRTLLLLRQSKDEASWSFTHGFTSAGDEKSLAILKELQPRVGSFSIRETQGQLFSVLGFSPDAMGHALGGDDALREVLSAVTQTGHGLDEVETAVVRRRRKSVRHLQELAKKPGTTETDMQRAIGDKYWLFGGRYVGIIPRRKFTFLDEYDIPLLCADGSLHIVELKGPCINDLVKVHRRHLIVGKDVHEAVGQTVNYLRALDDQRTALQAELSEELGVALDLRRVRSSVIIGHPDHVNIREREVTQMQIDQTIRSYNTHLSRIEVMTYNELLDSAERTLQFEEEQSEN
ncbi:Shedu anti-phage system protein SduA domain-containing protein [Streptomyces albidoflavus]